MNAFRHQIQLCFGQVRHARMRPVLHAFNYGVYFLRLPLRTLAEQAQSEKSGDSRSASTSGGKHAWFFSRNRFNILSFRDNDYGDGKQPLINWIDNLLQQEGLTDVDGEIWLQTFPRVLGYVFNPVSFWFCHDRNGALRAILAEVSNTFGERHCYLLDTGDTMRYGVELRARKIFHVSPFCQIDGDYHFRFMRADRSMRQQTSERHIACIDYHDAQGLLIQTSISGTSQPLSTRLIAKAFFLYPFMTFGVIAKIHLQALKLWIKRVPFFRKPPPPSCDISR